MAQKEFLQQVSDLETAVILEKVREILKKDSLKDDGCPGDIVEFGCYRGDTSLLIQKELMNFGGFSDGLNGSGNLEDSSGFSSRRNLWIYDSFEGLPARTKEDASVAGDSFRAGELAVSKNEVVLRFKKAGLKVPKIRKGFFENLDSSAESKDLPEKIVLAFLDGDLYQSIKTSLELVEPRMDFKSGAILIVHDYNNPQLPGAAKAVDEFLHKKPALRLERRETLAIISC